MNLNKIGGLAMVTLMVLSILLPFTVIPASATLFGDANTDTTIDMRDVTKIARMICWLDPETDAADANNDGSVNVLDIIYTELIILERVPFPGGELRAAMIFGPKSDSLDPAYSWTGWYVRKAGIYETLFSYDENMRLQDELATGYSQISDTEWRIYLRDGVRFHDGTPLNADAVIYSLERVMDPSNSRHTQYDFIESVSKFDEHTVTIITKEPYAPTIASLTDPVVSIVSPAADDLAHNPVGTGPFKFVDHEQGVSLTVTRNDDYWGGAVKLEGAIFYYVSDPLTRSLMLEGDDVDIARGIPQSEYNEIEDDPDLEVLTKETLRTYFMYVNTRKAPLDDVRVRQAINYCIDREEIVDTALEGVGGTPAKSVFPSILPWSANDELEGYTFNQAEALSLLEAAGITDTDGDGWLDYDGETFELTIKTYTKRPELQPTAEVMVSQLEDIGIKASVIILETGALKADMNDGNFDLALYAWGTAPTGDPDYFLSYHFESTGKYAGWTGYSNPDVDNWIELGRRTMNEDDRYEYYANVQEQILEDSPEIFVFYQNELVGENTRVIGYEIFPNEISFLTKDMYIGK